MPKHDIYNKSQDKPIEKDKTHPIWRGIGLILIIIIPVVSYTAAAMLINNRAQYIWLIIPQEIVITQIPDSLLLVKITYAFIIAFILAVLITLITFLINKIFGPSRYGPYDVKK